MAQISDLGLYKNMEEEIIEIEEFKPDVTVIIANPYQVYNVLSELAESEKLSLDDLFTLKTFCNNNFELQNLTLNKLGNYDAVFTNGKVFCFCWVASQEDKALVMLKVNAFFRPEYKFLDLLKDQLLTRIL